MGSLGIRLRRTGSLKAIVIQYEHRTSNFERRTSNERVRFSFDVRRWIFDVRRSSFLNVNAKFLAGLIQRVFLARMPGLTDKPAILVHAKEAPGAELGLDDQPRDHPRLWPHADAAR